MLTETWTVETWVKRFQKGAKTVSYPGLRVICVIALHVHCPCFKNVSRAEFKTDEFILLMEDFQNITVFKVYCHCCLLFSSISTAVSVKKEQIYKKNVVLQGTAGERIYSLGGQGECRY